MASAGVLDRLLEAWIGYSPWWVVHHGARYETLPSCRLVIAGLEVLQGLKPPTKPPTLSASNCGVGGWSPGSEARVAGLILAGCSYLIVDSATIIRMDRPG